MKVEDVKKEIDFVFSGSEFRGVKKYLPLIIDFIDNQQIEIDRYKNLINDLNPLRSAEAILEQTTVLAIQCLSLMGCHTEKGVIDFPNTKNPRSRLAWNMAVLAQLELTETDIHDVLEELEDTKPVKERLSAGLCDNCDNLGSIDEGDGREQPYISIPFCKQLNVEIVPTCNEHKEHRVNQCVDFKERL